MANPNLELLTAIANAMGPLRDKVVFVGGCATGLLITRPLVVDCREELLPELRSAPPEVSSFVAKAIQAILQNPIFSNVLPGIVSQSNRSGIVLGRLANIANIHIQGTP